MASAASSAARLCLMASRRAPRIQRITRPQQFWQPCVSRRAFTTTRPRRADDAQEDQSGTASKEDFEPLDLKRMDKSFMDSATPEGLRQLDELAKTNGFVSVDQYLEATLQSRQVIQEDRALSEELYKDDIGERPNKNSFWYDDADPETNTEEHDEFDEDDITSMAHGKLDEIREMRHYARLAMWEMPLLAKMAKPFEPPAENQVLRWRYTTYMGEAHPAERKVVVQFAPDDLKLTAVQTSKLKKLAGPRYNPDTELIKMSSESFEHQAQNKSYLTKLVDDLIAAAKDPKDTFEDVPLDLRHHQSRSKPRFPREWRLTDERRRELDEHRRRAAIADMEKAEGGLLVNGQQAIDNHLMQQLAEEQERQKAAELVAAAPRVGRGPASGSKARR